MTTKQDSPQPLPLSRIFRTWWPLAASWLLMAVELPSVSAVIARLPQPEISLAAWGGVIFPLALMIESPIIMLLAASTALCKDWQTYRKVRRFMMWAGGFLTAVHILVAFTPVYDVVVRGLIGAPEPIVEPGRLGLRLMVPWTWAIAYRRFNQGVLIRFGHSEAVGVGTVVRLTADSVVLGTGLILGSVPGVIVAGSAVAAGVISEAIYAGLRVRPVLRDQVMTATKLEEELGLGSFLAFYVPLALTSALTLLVQPLGSAALSRMPGALQSLAVWPVVSGLVFMLRSAGMAYNEVVVALLDEPRSVRSLRRYTQILATATTGILVLIAATPLAEFWFAVVSGLPRHLADLGVEAVWFALPLPALVVAQSWFQGSLVNARRTRGVTEAVALGLMSISLCLVLGVATQAMTGLFVVWLAFDLGGLVQMAWLWYRSRPAVRVALARDAQEAPLVSVDWMGTG